MATLTLRDENRRVDDPAQISAFLEPFGIWYRHSETGALAEDAEDSDVLSAYAAPIRELMQEGGYRSVDVIHIRPDLPGLEEMLAKFDKEHTHDEDEVRLIVAGRGLFHVHPEQGPVFAIEVERGDMINVPKGTRHWFHVCEARSCRAVRLFRDASGWTPHYTGSSAERDYPPVWSDRAR